VSGVVGVLLAAGAGSRFGGGDCRPKVLHPFRGQPLLRWPLAALREGGVDRVVVVLGARADEVVAGTDLGEAQVVRCTEWLEGLSASLRTGVQAAAGGADAVVIALADQPLLDARAVARLIAARVPSQLDALRATYAGVPGHPTLLESVTFGSVERLRGDAGARTLLDDPATRVGLIACDGLGRPDDVDTPEALARLEALA
jgi:CTP:molybdopterin cytidylyltransferase MocA